MLRQRVIWDDNGTLADESVSLNDYVTGSTAFALVAAQDKLYIGSDLPFNHRYFDVGTVNDQASAVSAEIYNGAAWESAVDVIDETSVGGVTLARSGLINWGVARTSFWGRADTTEDVPGLASLKIYEKYWVRLTWSDDLAAGTVLDHVGLKFSEDEDLAVYYSDLNTASVKTAFKTGKTDWNDQHYAAAAEIVKNLQTQRKAYGPEQVLRPDVFKWAAVHKVAAIIYSNFGDDYEDEYNKAVKNYMIEMKNPQMNLDRDFDGRSDDHDKFTHARVTRV